MSPRSMAAWPGRLVLIVLVVFAIACTGTTVISEGTLGSPPAVDDGGDGTASSTIADDADDSSDDGEGATTPGLGLVDDAQIAALAAACESGSDMACDILYQASALGSAEEDLARGCAGRQPANDGFCTLDIEPSDDGIWFDDASAGLAAVEDACVGGDLTACDFLYFRSAVGSRYEEIGTTCGGRIDVAIPDCRTVLAED